MKCPKCGSHVNVVDILGSEYDGGKYYDRVEGTCSNCGQPWKWVEVFTFDHCEDIEGIEIE